MMVSGKLGTMVKRGHSVVGSVLEYLIPCDTKNILKGVLKTNKMSKESQVHGNRSTIHINIDNRKKTKQGK